MILAVGFRIRSKRGVQFRQRANKNLKEYMVKGFLIDTERLKNPDGRPDYFDELLEKIRDIRASEKRFYQKVRDLFALSNNYDPTDKATQIFFAEAQNKILYAVTGQTAAELIVNRADPHLPNMALTNRKGSFVRKQDVFIAKNYLTEDELDSLNRFVVVFLEAAELRVKKRKALTIEFWKEHLEQIIQSNDGELLLNKGAISHQEMEAIIDQRYESFDKRRKDWEALEADRADLEMLEQIEQELKKE
jgi:hypothetical protein